MYKLLINKTQISQNIIDENFVHYFDFTLEDWYRAFCLLRYYWRKRFRDAQKSDDINKKQNITVESPTFFSERQLREYRVNFKDVLKAAKMKDESESKYKSDSVYEKKIARLIAKDRFVNDLFDLILNVYLHDHSPRLTTKLNDDIERGRARTRFDLRTLKNNRRLLNDRRMKRIIKHLNQRYHLIHPDFFERFKIIVLNTKKLKKMTKHFLRKSNAFSIDKFIQQKQNDVHEHRIETSAKDREKFFVIQKSMNAHTALVNDYDLICERLKFDFIKFLISDQYADQTKSKTKLKFHQIVTVDWLLKIKKTIENAFLTDDMGFGKIVIALIVIFEYAYRHDAIRFDQALNHSTSSINDNMSFINNISRQNAFHTAKSENNNVEAEKNVDDPNLDQSKNVDEKVWKRKLKNCQELTKRLCKRRYRPNLIIASFQIFSI